MLCLLPRDQKFWSEVSQSLRKVALTEMGSPRKSLIQEGPGQEHRHVGGGEEELAAASGCLCSLALS